MNGCNKIVSGFEMVIGVIIKGFLIVVVCLVVLKFDSCCKFSNGRMYYVGVECNLL